MHWVTLFDSIIIDFFSLLVKVIVEVSSRKFVEKRHMMGCHDYHSNYYAYTCPKSDCKQQSLEPGSFLGGAESYGRLCDDHWNEFFQGVVEKMLAGKSTEELLRDFAGMIYMLQRQSR